MYILFVFVDDNNYLLVTLKDFGIFGSKNFISVLHTLYMEVNMYSRLFDLIKEMGRKKKENKWSFSVIENPYLNSCAIVILFTLVNYFIHNYTH